MRTLVIAIAVLAATFAVPAPAQADVCYVKDTVCLAGWDCLQVYPWSRLCEGDVVGFLEAYLCVTRCIA